MLILVDYRKKDRIILNKQGGAAMALGERIKEYRQKVGLSQEALAEKINVSRQAITKWESNTGIPDIDNLISLSKVMGISLDELVMGKKGTDESDIKRALINYKKQCCTLYLTASLGFLFVWVCCLISLILSALDGNTVIALLSGINTTLLGFPIGLFSRKYFDEKQQESKAYFVEGI